jgi:outer membrane protein, heavy metal efflux system
MIERFAHCQPAQRPQYERAPERHLGPLRSASSAGLLLVFVASVVSAGAEAPARVAVSDLVADALARNPEVASARQRYDAMRQRPPQVRSLPDPMVSIGYNASGRPWPGAGLGTEPTSNIGFMVSQELPYPGKRDLRASMALRDVDAEFQQIAAARLSVTARVKDAYYRLAYTYAVGDVLTRNRDRLDTLLQVSENRYGVGQAAQQDVIKAQAELSLLELQLERTKQERATREGELNALLDRPPATPVGQPEDLELTPFDVSLDSLVRAAGEHAPMLRRDEIMVGRSQLAVDAARKEYKPDFALAGGYYYMGAMPPMYELRFDVKLPLQRARRAAAVAEQLSVVEQATSAYDVTRLDLQNRLQAEYQEASTSARLARLYRDTVLPQAQLALESSMASYQTGSVDFLSVLTNFGTVLQYEMTFFDELASYHAAVSRLEELTGMALPH